MKYIHSLFIYCLKNPEENLLNRPWKKLPCTEIGFKTEESSGVKNCVSQQITEKMPLRFIFARTFKASHSLNFIYLP